jgi:hypothetical protein
MFDEVIDFAAGGWGLGLALVVGGGLLLAKGGRPLIKKGIQGYLSAVDTVKSATAGLVEQAQDLYEESKAEVGSAAAEA